jgi:hypothetical protein
MRFGSGRPRFLWLLAALVVFGAASVSPAKPAGGQARLSGHSAAGKRTYWAGGVKAVLPKNAAVGKNQDVSISSVSCASAGNCSAVGTYLDSSGIAQGLLLAETAGKWGPGVEAALPANAVAGGKLGSVSCASAGNCSAVGLYNFDVGSGGNEAVLLTETAGVWGTGVEAVPPPNADTGPDQYVSLWSVSCASAGNCSAVGDYNSKSGSDGLLLTETAGNWEAGVEAVLPPGIEGLARLDGVSCASAGDCTAIGYTIDASANWHGLLLTETDGTWAAGVEAVLPANAVATGMDMYLTSISCASAGNCSAVGLYNIGLGRDGAGSEALLLTETAGVWATGVEAALPANAGVGDIGEDDASLQSISCSSAGTCTAVGDYFDNSDHDHGMLLTETNGTWAAGIEAALPANAVTTGQRVFLTSVSCASAGNCSAVGSYRAHKNSLYSASHGLLLTENAGRWATGVEAAIPGNRDASDLASISCPSAQSCSAVGAEGPLDTRQGLLLTSSGTPPCLVPKLTGKALPTAKRSITSHHCSVGRIKHATSRRIKKGHVISQGPAPGQRLSHGAKVSLLVSKGGH